MRALNWTIYLVLLGVLGVFLHACSDDSTDCNTCFPDFSQCDCTVVFDPACGEDGRNYLNDCYAKCLNVKIATATLCNETTFRIQDTMTWPIESVCIPVIRPESPFEIRLFSDGTVLYQNQDGSYFRGTQNFCRCLPPQTLIATPDGEKPIAQLKTGDVIWTFNELGLKSEAALVNVREVFVRDDHQVAQLRLIDGRRLIVSPLHPGTDGCPLGALTVGDLLDGSIVRSVELMPYKGSTTWDILPAGETGYYMADGIIIGSTLRSKGYQ